MSIQEPACQMLSRTLLRMLPEKETQLFLKTEELSE